MDEAKENKEVKVPVEEPTLLDIGQAFQLAQACRTSGISVDVEFREITFRIEGSPKIEDLQKETIRIRKKFGSGYKGWKVWFKTDARKILSTI